MSSDIEKQQMMQMAKIQDFINASFKIKEEQDLNEPC